jgi:hypothetical protein
MYSLINLKTEKKWGKGKEKIPHDEQILFIF